MLAMKAAEEPSRQRENSPGSLVIRNGAVPTRSRRHDLVCRSSRWDRYQRKDPSSSAPRACLVHTWRLNPNRRRWAFGARHLKIPYGLHQHARLRRSLPHAKYDRLCFLRSAISRDQPPSHGHTTAWAIRWPVEEHPETPTFVRKK